MSEQDDTPTETESTAGGDGETATPRETNRELTPDGGVAEPASDSVSDPITSQFEKIKETRKWRAIGWISLLIATAFVTLQGLVATEFGDTDFTWSHFGDRLNDYFPTTTYFEGAFDFVPVIDGIIFLDLLAYWEFMVQLELLYDPDIGGLLFQYPIDLSDVYAFFFQEMGMFAIFGEAGITLAMGFVGTIFGFPLALLFGVLGSERVSRFPFNFIFRSIMSFIRAVPAIIWTLIFVALVGLGAAAATIAIAFNTIGNLGRLFVDELEEIEDGPIEAMQTTGANKPQVVFFGMLSQVRTAFIAWTLYIFEINVRAAVTVGVVGAGGLGTVVVNQENLRNFDNMMATLIAIFILVILVELFSQRLRARLRSDEERRSWRELIFGFPKRFADSARR